MVRTAARWLSAVVAGSVVLGLAAVGPASAADAPAGSFPAVDQPGVTATEIRVSGVASTTNPLGSNDGSAFDGVEAYFDTVNRAGGIYGRKLVLTDRHDDQTVNNRREVSGIIDNDDPFAVLPVASILFSGADLLKEAGIPTFGWNISSDWNGAPNLFGHAGALCIGSDCTSPAFPSIARRFHKKRVALLAYSVPQSASCLDGTKASFAKYPTAKVVFSDKSLPFGVTDLSADVAKMLDAHADFVMTCMDQNGTLTLAREMRQQGLQAKLLLPNGYDAGFMAKNGPLFEGASVLVQEAPLETKPRLPALRAFVRAMDRAHLEKNENSLIGWVNADQFVTGLRAAGPDFTRQKVIDSLNRLTAYDAGGLIAPIDWTRQHTDVHYPLSCAAFLRVHDGRFVPQFAKPGKPFVCYRGPVTDVEDLQTFNRR